MTQTNDLAQRSAIAAAKLARVTEELEAAQSDVALLERLKSAQDRVKRLLPEQEAALAEAAAAKDAESLAREEQRFAGLAGISVKDVRPEDNVTRSTFEISYTRLAYDFEARTQVPSDHTVTGFLALPDEVFAFLIAKHPDKIPAKIMDLCPSNPTTAFERYFMALRRGFVSK